MGEFRAGFRKSRGQFVRADRRALAQSREQSVRPSADRLRAFAEVAQPNRGARVDIPFFSYRQSGSDPRARLTPASSAFRPDSAPAARGGGDITVAARRLPRSARAPFETPNTPRPIASRGKTRRRSRNNRAAPTVPA